MIRCHPGFVLALLVPVPQRFQTGAEHDLERELEELT
jgi:hypothetical protein